MRNLSQVQLINLWSQLEQCLHGTNRYAKDTAEIYANTLFTFVPCCNLPLSTDFGTEANLAQKTLAAHSLYEVCTLFSEIRDCRIIIDGVSLATWIQEYPGAWVRSHVQVVLKED
jgi:hypothetical protein